MGILKVDTVQDQDGNDIIQESSGTVTVIRSMFKLVISIICNAVDTELT